MMYGDWTQQDEENHAAQQAHEELGHRIADGYRRERDEARADLDEAKQDIAELSNALRSIQELLVRAHKLHQHEFRTELAGIMTCVTCMDAFQPTQKDAT